MKLKAIYWNFYFSFYPLPACSLVSHSIRWRFSTPVLDEELRYKIPIKMTFNGHFKSLLPCLLRSFISDSAWIWVSLLIVILSFCKFLGSVLLLDVLKVHIDVSRHRFFSFMLHPFILKALVFLYLWEIFSLFFFNSISSVFSVLLSWKSWWLDVSSVLGLLLYVLRVVFGFIFQTFTRIFISQQKFCF